MKGDETGEKWRVNWNFIIVFEGFALTFSPPVGNG
jgi:hypothetical protein